MKQQKIGDNMNNLEQMFWLFCSDNMIDYSEFLQDKDIFINQFYNMMQKHYTMEEIEKMVENRIIPTIKRIILEEKMEELQYDFD
jgi:hypothetical protein